MLSFSQIRLHHLYIFPKKSCLYLPTLCIKMQLFGLKTGLYWDLTLNKMAHS